MDRAAHRAWLETLAAENLRRRAGALPEIERKETLLRAERARLQAAQAAISDIEAALDEARRHADDPEDS